MGTPTDRMIAVLAHELQHVRRVALARDNVAQGCGGRSGR